ncbi:hypothetical protein [Nodosilinea nodulosa]|uniref:hypothetical protein n=1 Tax=Nodosilinea nodulosa TaxID=416001 RepID=UPI00031B67A9|nr:hypothetical protein [Nodosilinea nodulosa]
MKTQKSAVKRYLLGGLTAATLLIPVVGLASSAQASMGSHGVRGEMPAREAQTPGEKPQNTGIYPVSQSVQTKPQHLSVAEWAINPLNPNRPLNSGSHH